MISLRPIVSTSTGPNCTKFARMVELSPQMNNWKLFFRIRKLLWFEITKMLIAVNEKNLLCHLLYILTQFVPYQHVSLETAIRQTAGSWLSCGFMSHSTQNRSFRRRFPKLLAWYGKKTEPNTYTNQKKCTTTQKNTKKLKPFTTSGLEMKRVYSQRKR